MLSFQRVKYTISKSGCLTTMISIQLVAQTFIWYLRAMTYDGKSTQIQLIRTTDDNNTHLV